MSTLDGVDGRTLGKPQGDRNGPRLRANQATDGRFLGSYKLGLDGGDRRRLRRLAELDRHLRDLLVELAELGRLRLLGQLAELLSLRDKPPLELRVAELAT